MHQLLTKNIKNSMIIYNKNNNLQDGDGAENEETEKRKFYTLAAEINCLGALLKAEKTKRTEITLKQDIIENLLAVTSHHMTDPILLTSINIFAKRLLEVEEVKTSQMQMERYMR